MKERLNMFLEKIYIDGIDKTSEVDSYEEKEDEYILKYKGSKKSYSYSKANQRVTITKISVGLFDEFKKIADSIKIGSDFSALGKYYEGISIKENSLVHKYLNGIPFKTCNDDKLLVFPFKFNKSQLDATRKVFRNELSIIQGPPGTGKTQTILNIIANIIIRGKNVAIVSNNNAAVENIKDKLIKHGYGFMFALLGSKDNQKEFIENQVKDILDLSSSKLDTENLKRLKLELIESSGKLEELMEQERKKKIIIEQLNALKLEVKYYKESHDIENLDNVHISFINLGYEKIMDFLVEYKIMLTEKDKVTFINKFKLLAKYGIFKFKQLQEKELDVITHYQYLYYNLKIQDLEKKITECEKILEKSNFKDLADKHQKKSLKIFKHYLSQRFKKKEIYEMKTYKSKFSSFIKDYPVILSTAYSVTYSVAKGFVFDYVIVDEASTLDIVKALLPLSCADKIVIVGDQKQLPHIPDVENVTIENEAYDYKNKNIMDSLDCLYGDTIVRTLLREHYRCHPDIIRFCNLKYYEGSLIVYSDNSNKYPLSVIKTEKGNHMRELTRGRKGTFNQRELEELNYLISNEDDYNIKLYSHKLEDIGFISPYRLQIEYSKTMNSEEIEKDTVHKYQGREKPIIVFSTVLDKSVRSKIKMSFVNDSKLVNVAVSRAEKQLILISDTKSFDKNGNDIGDLIKYIEYHDINNIEKGKVISVFDLLYKEYSSKLVARKKAMMRVGNKVKYDSEKIIYSILNELMEEEIHNCYSFYHEVRLFDIFSDTDRCTTIEKEFIKQPRSSVDFIVVNKFNKAPVLAIEVDGTEFHLNNPEQLKRDKKKNGIFEKYNIPLLRLATHEAFTKDKIRTELAKVTEN